jgi:hypothetical protein
MSAGAVLLSSRSRVDYFRLRGACNSFITCARAQLLACNWFARRVCDQISASVEAEKSLNRARHGERRKMKKSELRSRPPCAVAFRFEFSIRTDASRHWTSAARQGNLIWCGTARRSTIRQTKRLDYQPEQHTNNARTAGVQFASSSLDLVQPRA